MNSRAYYWALTAVFVLALALRLGAAAAFQGLNRPPNFSAAPDQIDYELLAYNLSTGAGFTIPAGTPTARRAPGTSFTLLPVYAVTGRSFAWGRIWFALLSAMTCLATAWIARQCFGRPTAVVAAAWLACYPGHFYYAMHFVSEVPYALWLAIGCALSLRALGQQGRAAMYSAAGAGVFWGFAALTRPQTVFMLPVLALWWLLPWYRGFRRSIRSQMAVQIAAMLLVIAPWIVRNEIVLGEATVSTVGGATFWGAHNDIVRQHAALWGSWLPQSDLVDAAHPLAGTEVQRESLEWKYGLEFVRQNLKMMPILVGAKILRLLSPVEPTENRAVFWSFALSWICTLPWVAAGIWLLFRRHASPALFLLAPVVAALLTTVVFYGSIRFRDAMIPILIVFAAHGLTESASLLGVDRFVAFRRAGLGNSAEIYS
jgi:4-amino-4-deoxy-L-arabinose transferase-like glycosyltransferase